jgi:hypothetical protein
VFVERSDRVGSNDLSREFGSALGIAILGSLFNSGYSSAVSNTSSHLPPEAARAVEESAGAGLAVAAKLGPDGQHLAAGVRDAFASGLGDALKAGAVIAVLAAGYTVWRAPRGMPSVLTSEHTADELVGSASMA